jgi:hypothetical protein
MDIPFFVFLDAVGAMVAFVIVTSNRLVSLTERGQLTRRTDAALDGVGSMKGHAAPARDTRHVVVKAHEATRTARSKETRRYVKLDALEERQVLTVSLGS